MFSELKAKAWQLATIGAAGVAVVLTIMLFVSAGEKAFLRKENDRLSVSINDPVTGYIAKAAQCRTNVETLRIAVSEQNKKFDDLSDASVARIAQADKDVAAANVANRKLSAQIAAAMKPLVGHDTCARVPEFDERVLGSLK